MAENAQADNPIKMTPKTLRNIPENKNNAKK